MVLLPVLTLTWGLLMGRFQEGEVYWTVGTYSLAVAAVLALGFDTVLRELLKPSARDFAIGLGVGVVMTAATYPAYWIAAEWLPFLEGQVEELYAQSQQEPVAIALVWVVIILVVEELLWRAAWIETLSTYMRPGWAAALSVVLYAAAQLGSGSWLVGLLAVGCGALWTWLRMWTGSLWPSLLAHMVWTPVVIVLWPLT